MSTQFIQAKALCVELNCEKWFLASLSTLYGLREMGHTESTIYLFEDVKAALIAHAADGRPTKAEMEKKLKMKGSEDESD